MKSFMKNWNNKVIEDSGSFMSREATSFCTAFKNMLKRGLNPYGVEIVNFIRGHYYLSGFLRKDDVFIYINFNIPRGNRHAVDFQSKCFSDKVLYRYAKDERDYLGEHNRFTSIEELPEVLLSAFEMRSCGKAD